MSQDQPPRNGERDGAGPSVIFDTLPNATIETDERRSSWRAERTEFSHQFAASIEDNDCVQRIMCDDFPSSWQPARRIITFMGGVSLICTLIVIAIILIAVVLSNSAFPRNDMSTRYEDIVYLVPHPRMLAEKQPALLVNKDHPNIWKVHVAELDQLLIAYRDRQGNSPMASACDLRYAPTGGSSCYFPLEGISDNCSINNNFGYDSASPCVALIFNSFLDWLPQPFNVSNPKEVPEDIRSEYDPGMVYLTCKCNVTMYGIFKNETGNPASIAYSPYHGFPLQFISGGSSTSKIPPLVMVQFLGLRSQSHVHVICSLWARNIPKDVEGAGNIKFNFIVM